MSRIIVKNLPDKITKEKLLQVFSEKGKVTDVQLKFTKEGKFRKFAFVGFQKPESASAAKESLNKSFINTSQIQIEICAGLGDPNKPRAWSKHAAENLLKKRKFEDTIEKKNNKIKMAKNNNKEKIKDPEVVELLKNYKDDAMFTEFLEANVPEIPKLESEEKSEEKEKEEKIIGENSDEEKEEERKNILANKDISDSEYIKLKTGKNINIKTDTTNMEVSTENQKKKVELFTVKISGLPFNVKKSEIKEFLKPLKAFTIRKALKINGVAYCGFKNEKEMKLCLFKHKSFLRNKRIFITKVRKEDPSFTTGEITKWKKETERLKNLESVAESGRIFVRNLAYTVSEETLKTLFEKYGPITEFYLPIDSFTRKPKGFAFVTYLIPENACKAFYELDGSIFEGRMLHLIQGLPKKASDEEDDSLGFKEKKLQKEKAKSGSNINWNTFFVGENALAESMAATYNTTKENVLDDKQGGTAVRLALGETQLVNKMKEFLEENGVCLKSFENMTDFSRSNTVILVKNLPFGTKLEEIREKFCKFGEIKRIVLPPTGVAALVEFIEPSEAKKAFRRVAYSKFKHVPMYLEWAPKKVFIKDQNSDGKDEDKVDNKERTKEKQLIEEKKETKVEEHIPVEGATIFVKNLNFVTDDESLRKHFETCGTVVSAKVARKKDPNHLGKTLSMGYGFVEFSDKTYADNALKTLQFSNLDDHKIELKRSNRTISNETMAFKKTTKSQNKPNSKILVRNIPFQATQKEVADLFKVFGEIKAVRLPKKMVGMGSHRGFCFVEYNNVNDAKRAFEALSQSTHLYGRRLVLEWAEADSDVTTLREKTAQQFASGPGRDPEKQKKITIEEKVGEED